MNIEKRIEELGITLPLSSPPKAMYIPVCRTGNLLFVAGQIPSVNGEILHPGRVGEEITLEEGQEAARQCIINIFCNLQTVLGDLNRIKRVVKMLGFVACEKDFYSHPRVIDGASVFLKEIMGDAGVGARSAVGVYNLPGNMPVEIEVIFELKEE